MISVPEVVTSIIRKSPFLEEGLSQGIINISALARRILPEVRRETMKDIKEGAVIMALNRLSDRIQKGVKAQSKLFTSVPDLMVRSNLFEITLINTRELLKKRRELLEHLGARSNVFITFTQGIFETTIIAGRDIKEMVVDVFQGERVVSMFDNLSSITVQLPPGTADFPGAYDFLLRALSWENINLVEVVSTFNEFTMVLRDEDIDRAFFVLKRLF